MTTFPITKSIRRHLGPALAAQFPRRDWRVTDITATDSTLFVDRPLTAEDVAAIQGVIARISSEISELAERAANIDTFAWMRGKQAQQWRRTLQHR